MTREEFKALCAEHIEPSLNAIIEKLLALDSNAEYLFFIAIPSGDGHTLSFSVSESHEKSAVVNELCQVLDSYEAFTFSDTPKQ